MPTSASPPTSAKYSGTSDIPRYIRTDMPLYLQKRKNTLFETLSQKPLVLLAHRFR